MRRVVYVILLILLSTPIVALATNGVKIDTLVYKNINSTELTLEVFHPDPSQFKGERPAIVLFFGGGWIGGTTEQFARHAQYLAERGMVAFLAEYRTKKSHNVTPYECVMDAKSAMRYIRSNAKRFNIDPDRIAAGGGSAGGHLAASTAVLDGYNDTTDDLQVSCRANALLLFNPVLDNGPAGYGYERVGDSYKEFSPLHNLKAGAPPTIIFIGDRDKLIPLETMKYYSKISEILNNKCELHIYEGVEHGFFNQKEYYEDTIEKCHGFLVNNGFLEE